MVTFCPILFSAFGFKLRRFVDYNRNSCSLRRYERIHGRMHIVQKVPRAFSNWQAAFSGSQGTLVLSVPQEHHVYNLQNIQVSSCLSGRFVANKKKAKWMTYCWYSKSSMKRSSKISVIILLSLFHTKSVKLHYSFLLLFLSIQQ